MTFSMSEKEKFEVKCNFPAGNSLLGQKSAAFLQRQPHPCAIERGAPWLSEMIPALDCISILWFIGRGLASFQSTDPKDMEPSGDEQV